MKFSIERDLLLKPLQSLCGVVEKRQTLPILSNLLVKVEKNKLYLTATDLEVEMHTSISVKGTDPGETSFSARKFLDICRTLPEGALIDVSKDASKVTIKSGKSRFSLTTLDPSEFPSVDAVEQGVSFSIAQNTFRRLIENTQFAMAQQDVRYYLNGLMLELSQKGLRCVATDGHRLAMCDGDVEIRTPEIKQVIVPRKAIIELGRLLDTTDDEIRVDVGTNHIHTVFGETTFTSKLIDGRFPDYQRVVPQGGNKIVIADKELLKQSLTRVSILSNEKYRGVRFTVSDGLLQVQAHNPDQEEAEEELSVDYTGGDLEIGFNVTYFIDVLNVIPTDKVQIVLLDSSSSCLIQEPGNEDCKYVVMPMRL